MKNLPGISASRRDEGTRLAHQIRRKPIEWIPGQREALIQQALSAGKVQQCPPAHADGILNFNTGSMMHPMNLTRKAGVE